MKTRWRSFLPALACSLLAQTNFPQQSLQTGARLAAAAARRNFRETPGIAVDSRQHVFVIHRGEHPIMEFDAAGHFVRSFGDTLFDRAHAVRFDPEGNLWAVDDGSHVVLKLDSEGHARMVLGRCRKPATLSHPSGITRAP